MSNAWSFVTYGCGHSAPVRGGDRTLARHCPDCEMNRSQPMDQHLVDYTVRNITTGDEEEIRVLELTDEEVADLPTDARAVLEPHRTLWRSETAVLHPEWETAQQRVLELLLPHISDRALYDSDYGAWERRVLGDEEDFE